MKTGSTTKAQAAFLVHLDAEQQTANDQRLSSPLPLAAPAAFLFPMIFIPISQQRTSSSLRNGLGRGFGARGELDRKAIWLSNNRADDDCVG